MSVKLLDLFDEGFYRAQEVIAATDLASQTDVRLMASVYFKNSVNRYWRSRRDST